MLSIDKIFFWLLLFVVIVEIPALNFVTFSDELAVMLFLLVVALDLVVNRDLARYKALFVVEGVFLFYFFFSVFFRHYNTTAAIANDFILQQKAFVPFLIAYAIAPQFTSGMKTALKVASVAVAAMFFGDELRELFSATGKQTENVTGVVQQADLKANVEKIQKTKDAVAFLKAIKAYADVAKVINGKYNRSSKGSMRRSAFKTRKGPLVVYNKDEGIVKAFRNIPGVDVQCVTRLSLYQLAPGAVLGRFVIWTEGAFNALDGIYESKKGFELPRSLLSNADLERVAYSNEVQAILRPAQQTFSVPKARCPCRLGLATKEWEEALNQIEALRKAYHDKQHTPEAIMEVFKEIQSVQPPAPETLAISDRIFAGYFDSLHKKEDDALEAKLEADKPAPPPKDPAPADAKGGAAAAPKKK